MDKDGMRIWVTCSNCKKETMITETLEQLASGFLQVCDCGETVIHSEPNTFIDVEKNFKNNCNIYKEYCSVHDFIHGAEAEELREGIQKLIDGYSYYLNEWDNKVRYILVNKIQNLLDKIDARDSIAYLDTKKV